MSHSSILRPFNWLFWLLLIGVLAACSSSKEIKDGQTAFRLKKYHLAASLLQKDVGKAKDAAQKREVLFLIAESYRLSNRPAAAEQWYARATRQGFDPDVQLAYGAILMENERYQAAADAYSRYIEEEPYTNAEARKGLRAAQMAMRWQSERNNVAVKEVEDLNSPYSDFAAALFKNNRIVFTSSRSEATGEETFGWTGEEFGDLFIANRKKGERFSAPERFSDKINSPYNEGTAAFSPDFLEMYFTRCPVLDDKKTTFCQIYHSRFLAGEWSDPERLVLFEDTCNVGHPALSPDGALWFATDFEGGFGGKDLFYVLPSAQGWSQPYNAGRKVNTWNDDMFPYVDPDGVLYFASNGHGGMGGLDIFKARKVRNTWSRVENLKAPINSGADDFAFMLDKIRQESPQDPVLASGYFSSSRKGGKGGDDIYRFVYRNLNFFTLEGTVVARGYEDPQDPDSRYLGMEALAEAAVVLSLVRDGSPVTTLSTDPQGRFRTSLEPNTDYKILASREGYFTNSVLTTTQGKGTPDSVDVTVRVQIELGRIFPDKEILIPNIYYDFNQATLRPGSLPVLDSLLTLFYENPDIRIEIGSHTDSRGTFEYNDGLSQDRAESVVGYLVDNGVGQAQLRAQGYGERKLVNRCSDGVGCDEKEHQANRRTTFRVISKDKDIRSVVPKDIQVDPDRREIDKKNE